ncbi:MAG TPA: polymorphic toxin-type HINT domain-containing protein [Capsulimonadaceae bacterium]
MALEWDPVDGATSYDVFRAIGASIPAGATAYRTGVTGTSATDEGLTNGTDYFYAVVAHGPNGTSDRSPEADAIPADQPPTIDGIVVGNNPPAGGATIVTGDTTTVSVGVTISGGSTPTYSWSANGPGTVTFSPSNSPNPEMRFTAAGTYTITVTVTAGGQSSTQSTIVTVEQTATSITISPKTATVPPGGTWYFLAFVADQFGDATTGKSVIWSPGFTSPNEAYIEQSGIFHAPSSTQTVTLTASAAGVPSATATAHVSDETTTPATGHWVPVLCYEDGNPVNAGNPAPYSWDIAGFWSLPYPLNLSVTSTVTNSYTDENQSSGLSGSTATRNEFSLLSGRVSASNHNPQGGATGNGSVTLTASATSWAYGKWRYVDSNGQYADPPIGVTQPENLIAKFKTQPTASVSASTNDYPSILFGSASASDGSHEIVWPELPELGEYVTLAQIPSTDIIKLPLTGSISLSTTNLLPYNGSNEAVAQASADIDACVQLVPLPTVTITSPAADAVLALGSTGTITATADPILGGIAALQSITFTVDGAPATPLATPPYSASWPVTAGIHTVIATANYAGNIPVKSPPVIVYGGSATPALTVEDVTGGWQPNPANVGDTITGTVKAVFTPSSMESDGSGPTYVTHEWSTAGVYRSDTGDAGSFTTYAGNYSIGYRGHGKEDQFHAVFFDPGYYILKVTCAATVHDSHTGATLSALSATGWVGGTTADLAASAHAMAARAAGAAGAMQPRAGGAKGIAVIGKRSSASSAVLELHKRYSDGTVGDLIGTGTPIGDTVFAVLRLTIAPGNKLTDMVPYTLQVKENDPEHVHAAGDKLTNKLASINPNSRLGWEVSSDNGTTWQAATKPPSNESASGAMLVYRYKTGWDTLHHNWTGIDPNGEGHNGPHTVSIVDGSGQPAPVHFAAKKDDGTFGTAYDAGATPVEADVENLSIVSVSPDDAVIVKKGALPVDFSIKLKDYCDDKLYHLVLTICRCSSLSSPVKIIRADERGLSHILTWDLKDSAEALAAKYGGYFTYDLSVQRDGDTMQSYRTTLLSVNSADTTPELDDQGDPVTNGQNKTHIVDSYSFSATPGQNSVDITFYQSSSQIAKVVGLSDQARSLANNPIDTWLDLAMPLDIVGVVSAKDMGLSAYRDHKARRVLNAAAGIAMISSQPVPIDTMSGQIASEPAVQVSSAAPIILMSGTPTLTVLGSSSSETAHAQITLAGTVKSGECDLSPSRTIASISAYVDDPDHVIAIPVTTISKNLSGTGGLNHPYAYLGSFNQTIDLPDLAPGEHQVHLDVSSGTKYDNCGQYDFRIEVTVVDPEADNLSYAAGPVTVLTAPTSEDAYPSAIQILADEAIMADPSARIFVQGEMNPNGRPLIPVLDDDGAARYFVGTYDGSRVESSLQNIDPDGIMQEDPNLIPSSDNSWVMSAHTASSLSESGDFLKGFCEGFVQGGVQSVKDVSSLAVTIWNASKNWKKYFNLKTVKNSIQKVKELKPVLINLCTIVQSLANRSLDIQEAVLCGNFEALDPVVQSMQRGLQYGYEVLMARMDQVSRMPAEEAGRSMGGLMFQVVTIIVPYAKAGRLASLTKSQFLTDLLAKVPSMGSTIRAAKLACEGGNMCFVAGTLVVTNQGPVAIQNIRSGDQVLSRDPFTGRQSYKSVLRLIRTNPHILYRVRYRAISSAARACRQPQTSGRAKRSPSATKSDSDGDSDADDDGDISVTCTGVHPIYVVNRATFVPASELENGDLLLSSNGTSSEVCGVDKIELTSGRAQETYNLDVDYFHTYFVGQLPVWVHNSSTAPCEMLKVAYVAFRDKGVEPLEALNKILAGSKIRGPVIAKAAQACTEDCIADAIASNDISRVPSYSKIRAVVKGHCTPTPGFEDDEILAGCNIQAHHIVPKWIQKTLRITGDWNDVPAALLTRDEHLGAGGGSFHNILDRYLHEGSTYSAQEVRDGLENAYKDLGRPELYTIADKWLKLKGL